MSRLRTLFAFVLLFSALGFAAEFSATPYLYSTEKSATLDTVSFQTSANGSAKLIKINGEEALLVVDDKLVGDKAAISSIIGGYYLANFYPSQPDLSELRGFADAFNKSRNYMTRYGPAEKMCYESGTFLAYRPCNDYASCFQTASLVCSITGAEGCLLDVLATYITDYKMGIDSLNSAYAKFDSAYLSLGPAKITASLSQMDEAFDTMKTAADAVSKTKLRFPEKTSCADCIGVCPEPNFDYSAITSGKSKVASLRAKTAPYAAMEQTVDRIAISTEERVKYRAGEEKAAIFAPKYNALKAKYGGLKAQAVEAKALVSDSAFVSVADSFLAKTDSLELKLENRQFDGFDALLSGYESSAKSLSAVINNSTSSYRGMADAQDSVVDQLIVAQWSVNRLSTTSVDTYNTLAEREKKLDARIKPPMSSLQYDALASDYGKLEADAKVYVASSSTLEGSVFGMSNAIGRTSVDGAMSIASSMIPISFKSRQSFAAYVPPLVLAAADLALLAVALLVFVGAFYYFHGFFKSKIAVSGWALSMLAFVFVLLVGSVGFYTIVLSTEKFSTFTDFMGTVKASDSVAIIIEKGPSPDSSYAAMKACADQIEAQLKSMGKKTLKYYLEAGSCKSVIPRAAQGNNTSTVDIKSGLPSSTCLDALPDIPVFDLQYSPESQAPTFTTVVAKQAIFKGSEEYYGKKPMCDAANVLK